MRGGGGRRGPGRRGGRRGWKGGGVGVGGGGRGSIWGGGIGSWEEVSLRGLWGETCGGRMWKGSVSAWRMGVGGVFGRVAPTDWEVIESSDFCCARRGRRI